jgi:hypothetical protein
MAMITSGALQEAFDDDFMGADEAPWPTCPRCGLQFSARAGEFAGGDVVCPLCIIFFPFDPEAGQPEDGLPESARPEAGPLIPVVTIVRSASRSRAG